MLAHWAAIADPALRLHVVYVCVCVCVCVLCIVSVQPYVECMCAVDNLS